MAHELDLLDGFILNGWINWCHLTNSGEWMMLYGVTYMYGDLVSA